MRRTLTSQLVVYFALLMLFALWLGPTHIRGDHVAAGADAGRQVSADPRFPSERNYIRYNLPTGAATLPRGAIERRLTALYGVNADAIFNINNQRGQPELRPDSLNQIRIPLTPKARN